MDDFTESDLKTTVELLELLRKYQKYKGFSDTDYRLAKVLSVTPQAIARLLQQGGIMSENTAIALANELGLPVSYVLLCVWHEKHKSTEAKEAIQEIATKYLKVSVFLLAFNVVFNTFFIINHIS